MRIVTDAEAAVFRKHPRGVTVDGTLALLDTREAWKPVVEAAEAYVRRGPRAPGAWTALFDAVQHLSQLKGGS